MVAILLQFPRRTVTNTWVPLVGQAANATNATLGARIITKKVAKRLKFPMGKVLVNVDRYGNTSAATIPTMLDEANRDGRIKSGQTVLLDAFGAGLTYGAILVRW